MEKIIITGANRGIGLELAKKFKNEHFQVTALCRQTSKELNDLDIRIFENAEVTDLQAIAQIAEQLKSEKFEILLNNAGIFLNENLNQLDEDAFEDIAKQIQINSIAPLKVTSKFLPLINDGGKLAYITSRMGSISDNSSGGYYGYRMSKAALNAAAKSLAVDLQDRDIAIGIIHPGFVKTDMTNHTGDIAAKDAAENIFNRIMELNIGNSGKFFHAKGSELGW